jgi:Cof subfamily protein (haloacid dehalogenase superfamily)
LSERKKFSGILVITDFDDTFFDRGYIPERNLIAIDYFMKNGGYFTVNTARPVDSLKSFLSMFSINAPAALCNGAIIYDFEKQLILKSYFIDPHAFTVAKEVYEKFQNVRIELYTATGAVVARDLAVFDEKTQSTRPEGKLIDIFTFNEPVTRILFLADREIIKKVADYTAERSEGKYEEIRTLNKSHCIMPCGVNKGTALINIANILNVSIKNTYAIGDSFNDIDMIRVAGKSACPANAAECLKEVCELIVCDMIDGAVADLIDFIDRNMGKTTT